MSRSGKGPISIDPALMLIVALLVTAASPGSPADEPASKSQEAGKVEATARLKDDALKAAESYLVLLDKGKYAESWDASAEAIRKGLTKRKWVDALSKSRKPFGRIKGRKLDRIVMNATRDPGRIDQAWVFSDLLFASGETSSELVIVFFEQGKAWKVTDCFIGDPGRFPKPPSEKEKAPEPLEK